MYSASDARKRKLADFASLLYPPSWESFLLPGDLGAHAMKTEAQLVPDKPARAHIKTVTLCHPMLHPSGPPSPR